MPGHGVALQGVYRMGELQTERIVRIEKVVLRFRRPRVIGHNARIGTHGDRVVDPVVRIHTHSGAVGVGWSRLDRARAESLVGRKVGELFALPDGALDAGQVIDLPLWDLAAIRQDPGAVPCHRNPYHSHESEDP